MWDTAFQTVVDIEYSSWKPLNTRRLWFKYTLCVRLRVFEISPLSVLFFFTLTNIDVHRGDLLHPAADGEDSLLTHKEGGVGGVGA